MALSLLHSPEGERTMNVEGLPLSRVLGQDTGVSEKRICEVEVHLHLLRN